MRSCNDEEEACSSVMQSSCKYKNNKKKEEEASSSGMQQSLCKRKNKKKEEAEEEASISGMQLPCSSKDNKDEEEAASSSGMQLTCSSSKNNKEEGGGSGGGGPGGGGGRPKGTGRKKIEIKRIEHKMRRKVAFSKRRKGLFKKTSEICKLCGAEIAVVVFSPKGKLFSCGHPSVEHVVDRFLEQNRDEPNTVSPETTAEDDGAGGGEEEEGGYWFDGSIEKLEIETLEEFVACLKVLKKNLSMTIDEWTMRRTREIDFLGGFGGP